MNPAGTPTALPREQTDLPAEVAATPAPALPVFAAPFSLRPADPDSADPETLAEWMTRPHLLESWEQDWDAERRRDNFRAQLAGTYSIPCILSLDFAVLGEPELGMREVAYVEFYRAAKDEIGRFYDSDPGDIGFHIATADTAVIGKGIMSGWISAMTTAVFAADPTCRRVLADPDHRNVAIARGLAKAGFRLIGEIDVRPDRRISLQYVPRTPHDIVAPR
ncbi:GNAT family N-acetyltransferase [Nocardia alba]|uniref:Lysine N-acyltransferase MbtK n=1 Tax=Nocardia alba TaxID=225051 RepID=A0A4R1FIV7_9NOCA|nr:GNAT family N-acetyltransferase [Nocardia alba]TCJ94303.1 RimJ/RimL family protein N-acetyltransferase [Nocardia alba]